MQTFQPVELVATKIRALYQRSKGRDLFDLWLALNQLHLPAATILAAFDPYRPEGLTAARARDNLAKKLQNRLFRTDLDPLITTSPDSYQLDAAATQITNEILGHLDD